MGKIKMNKTMINFALLAMSVIFVLGFTGVTFASSDSGGHGGGNHWLQVDTWKVLNFAILAIGGFLLLKKPAADFFSSRKKNIKDEITALEQKKADAQKQLAEYQDKFDNLDKESKKIVENYIKQGKEAETRIIEEAKAQADKLEDMAKHTIKQEFKSAKAKLQLEIAQKAIKKAGEVIKASISSDDQDKLVDQYLKKVVA